MGIIYEKEGHIATITINRPEALNAFDPETITEFSKALISVRDDDDVWVCIITGAGKRAFSVGADLKKLIPAIQEGFEVPPTIMRGLEIWKPFIAAVNGHALGGGLEVALACDIRIASENATFGLPEVRWAIIPGWGGTQRLPRVVPHKALEMLITGQPIDAQEALRIGLVSKVVPQDELMPTAKDYARKICENGPLAVRAAKEAAIRGFNMSLEEGLRLEMTLFDRIAGSEDAKEGPRAFSERRKPEYKAK